MKEFVKIFIKTLKVFFDLQPASIKLFCYIATELDYKDKVYLSPKKSLKYMGYDSESSYRRAVNELIKNNIIANSDETNWYWVNPAIFYKGSRISLIEQYVDKEMEKFKKESDKQSYFEKALRKFMIEWSNNKEE